MTTQTRTHHDRTGSEAIAAAVAAIVALGGTGKTGNSGDGANGGVVLPSQAASPSAPPPTTRPTATPTIRPTATPIPTSKPIHVRIATLNHADVTVDIVDETDRVLDARSGPPVDGASVDFDRVQVENVDATTLRLTWSDYPMDSAITLFVSEGDGKIRLVLVRPGPTETTDAIAFDRQLLLRFATPLDAADVDPFVQDGLDTAG